MCFPDRKAHLTRVIEAPGVAYVTHSYCPITPTPHMPTNRHNCMARNMNPETTSKMTNFIVFPLCTRTSQLPFNGLAELAAATFYSFMVVYRITAMKCF